MKGYYSIDASGEIIKINGDEIPNASYRLLFKSPGVIEPSDLEACLTSSLRRVLHPDIILLVCIPRELDKLKKLLKENSEVQQSLQRASSKVCVALSTIDKSGRIEPPVFLKNPLKKLALLNNEKYSEIYKNGLAKLFDTKHVLVESPAGFTFVKPSKKRSTYFLRTEEALFETERVSFLAFSLLEKVSFRETDCGSKIDVIFIDTMAISSVAYIFREIYSELYNHPPPRIESFHSYGGMKEINTPRPRTALCLISASSSMNMQNDWIDHTNCHKSEVITLITLKNAKNSSDAIYAINYQTNQHSRNPDLKDLRIIGERFSPENTPIKKVLLRSKQHKHQRCFNNCGKYSASKIFSILKNTPENDSRRSIFVDGSKLSETDEFKAFVKKELLQKVSYSIQRIIHQEDESSKKLAIFCANELNKIRAHSDKIPISTDTDIELPDETEALLVVATVIGRGSKLRAISRALRDIHTGARHYLIGMQLSEKNSDAAQLEGDLIFSSSGSNITVSSMESIAIGDSLYNSFNTEQKKIGKWKPIDQTKYLKERIDSLKSKKGENSKIFLPSTAENDKPLKLRDDFAFWKSGYNDSVNHSASLLVTISSILQNSRESRKFKNDNDRLASDAFQQVVLSPENFSRYNDGIIQAALLRSALPSELDYSSDTDASKSMLDILLGIFNMHSNIQGEAALEFAYAIYIGKLKLSDIHTEKLKDNLTSLPTEKNNYIQLLKDLLSIGCQDNWGDDPSL